MQDSPGAETWLIFTLAEGEGIAFRSVFLLFGCLSVCLFVCQSPTGHNFKPIFTKLYQVREVVSTEKPLDFELKGKRSSLGKISKILYFH